MLGLVNMGLMAKICVIQPRAVVPIQIYTMIVYGRIRSHRRVYWGTNVMYSTSRGRTEFEIVDLVAERVKTRF